MGKKGKQAGNIYSSLKKQGKWNPVDNAKASELAGSPFKLMGGAPPNMPSRASILADAANKAHEEKWAAAQEASGGDLNTQVSIRNASEKGSEEWTNSQNLVNEYLGDSTRHTYRPKVSSVSNLSVGENNPTLMPTSIIQPQTISLEQRPVAEVDEISPKQQRAANKLARQSARPETARRNIRMAKQSMKAAGMDRKDIRAAKTKMKAENTIDQIEAARKAGKMGKVARLQKKVKRQKNRHTRLTK